MIEHWVIVGASSAIARAFARECARHGALVTLAGRDLEDLEATAADLRLRGAIGARVVCCDVSDAQSRSAAAASADWLDSRLNLMIAVGDMPDQPSMDEDPALLRRMVEANYLGPMALLNALAPRFEAQRGGRVVVLGSVAGDRGRRKNYLYGSAKAGLATYTEGLRARLFVSGATVTLVKPGFVDTAMTWGLPGMFLVAAPKSCAAAVYRAALRGCAELYHPFFWRYIMLTIRHLPSAIMKRLNF